MIRHPRTIVLARRRRSPPGWLPWLLLATGLALASMQAARAQTTTPPAPLPPKTDQTGPTTVPPAGTGQTRQGVIRPPAAVDPGMTRSTPNAGAFPTPVIPPPGTQGGNPRIIAK